MKKFIFPMAIALVLTFGTTVAFAGEYGGYEGNDTNNCSSYDGECERPDANIYAKREATNVTIQNFTFAPVVVTISPGTTVRWNNQDTAPDAIVGDAGYGPRSGQIETGESYDYRYAHSGTYRYHGSRNPQVVGTVIVTDAGPRTNEGWNATAINADDHQYDRAGCAEKYENKCQDRQNREEKCQAKDSGLGECTTPPTSSSAESENREYDKREQVTSPPAVPPVDTTPAPAPRPVAAPSVSTVSASPVPASNDNFDKGGAALPNTGAADVAGVAAIFSTVSILGAALYQLFLRRKVM
jgi:plastocyanin